MNKKRIEVFEKNAMNGEVENFQLCNDFGEVNDGYHTFNELYDYRMAYNAAWFNELAKTHPEYDIHKAKRHSNGELCFGGGWFVVVAELPTGQITNHYEMRCWDLFNIKEKEMANKWDGHTPQQAYERMINYIKETL